MNSARHSLSQRDYITQPRVARHELPWETGSEFSPTLKGLHHRLATGRARRDGCNPFRVEKFFDALTQGSAPAAQPWAGGWNPFRILARLDSTAPFFPATVQAMIHYR